MTKLKKILIALAAAFLLLLVTAFYSGLTLRRYTLQTDKISEATTFVLLTDLHSTIHGENQQSLIDLIKQQNPDAIFLAGDIADDEVPILGTSLLLEGIRNLCPIYYVTGNHEYWSNEIDLIREEIRSYGVEILSDEYVPLEIKGAAFLIGGLEDPDRCSYEQMPHPHWEAVAHAFGDLAWDDTFKVLLAHRPEHIDQYRQYPFDLVVSGHAHGGQVRIPFLLNGLYAPNQGWFPAYAGGLYTHGATTHVVSRGLSINPRLPRIYNPPELVVITLELMQ